MSAQPAPAQTTAPISHRLLRVWWVVAAALMAILSFQEPAEDWLGTAAVVLFVLAPAVLRFVIPERTRR